MKAKFAIVKSHNNAFNKHRKVRCGCSGDGDLTDSKQFKLDQEEGKRWKRADFFNHNEVEEYCNICEIFKWYTI